jgi:hypothetical protein
MKREHIDDEGLTISDMTDELTQRAIWKQWKKMMTQEAGAGTTRKRASRTAVERA